MTQTAEETTTLIKLDFACGQSKQPDHIGIDIAGDPDIVCDLFSPPYPFESNYADEIFSSHFVEHLPMEYVDVEGKKKDCVPRPYG